jgi:hypothetical protein
VSAGKEAVEVLPTRIHITRIKVLRVHDRGSSRQRHRIQFPRSHMLETECVQRRPSAVHLECLTDLVPGCLPTTALF